MLKIKPINKKVYGGQTIAAYPETIMNKSKDLLLAHSRSFASIRVLYKDFPALTQKDTDTTTIRERFNHYKAIWEKETKILSAIDDIIENESYQAIIKQGKDVVPFIIDELKKNNKFWFHALEVLTGEDPVKKEHWGNPLLMKNDWLQWAKYKL